MKKNIPTVCIGGVDTICLSRNETAKYIISDCPNSHQKKKPKLMFTINGQGLSLSVTNKTYGACLKKANIVRADGGFIVAASHLFTKQPIKERSATTDFIHDVAICSAYKSVRFFLLGASEQINIIASNNLHESYPNLQIAGRHHGYFSKDDEPKICKKINDSQADIVWIGMGKPKEQLFCIRNQNRINASWLVTCGGCFNFIAGDYTRAPAWMQNMGLEWLYRMLTNPKKLFWRYLTTNPHALFIVLTNLNKKIKK